MQFSPVINILGLLTTVLAAAMLIPMCVDLYSGSGEWQVFALSALLTGFFGVSVWLATNRREALDLGLRQAFLLASTTDGAIKSPCTRKLRGAALSYRTLREREITLQ